MILRIAHEHVDITFMTDIHLADTAPGRRRGNYRQAIMKKMAFVRDNLDKSAGVCLCGGDLFHLKAPERNSHGMVRETIELFQSFPQRKVFGIVGNHDISEDNMVSLPQQPLGVVIESGAYEVIKDPFLISFGDNNLIQIHGFDHDDSFKIRQAMLDCVGDERASYHVAVVHAMGGPGGDGSFFGELKIGYDTLTDSIFDVVLWGHDHSRIEKTRVGNTTHIHYGSLARASLNSDEVDRRVSVPMMTFTKDGYKIKELVVPTTPLETTFVVADSKVRKMESSVEIKDFFQGLEDTVAGIETDDPVEVLDQLCDDAEVKALITEVCDL